MTDEELQPDDDQHVDQHDDGEIAEPERRSVARDDVIKLTVVGVILLIVGGLGTWYSKWDTGGFASVEVGADRLLKIEHDCNASTRLNVDTSTNEIRVRLLERRDPSDGDCQSFECVTLDQPLAGRPVVNAGTDVEVFVIHVETLTGCPDT